MDTDELIERIVFMFFDCEVDTSDPWETIQKIKDILNREIESEL